MKIKFLSLLIVLLSFVVLTPVAAQEKVHNFRFTLLDDSTVELADYAEDKVVLLDWGASWCTTCKQNQERMDVIYQNYSDYVSFLTISYGGSGDDLTKVAELKQDYVWDFGLDHTNYAGKESASNGHIWILNNDLTMFHDFGYGVQSSASLANTLNDALENLVPDVTFSDLSEDVETLGLFENPLFIGFLVVMTLGIVVYIGTKFSKSKM